MRSGRREHPSDTADVEDSGPPLRLAKGIVMIRHLGRGVLTLVIAVSVASTVLAGPAHADGGPPPVGPSLGPTLADQQTAASCLIDPQVASRCAPPGAAAALRSMLATFARIPERVLRQGDAATRAWLRDNTNGGSDGRRTAVTHPDRGGAFAFIGFAEQPVSPTGPAAPSADVVRCIGAIGAVVAGLLIPAVKILKIKKLMEQIGGVWETVRLLIGGSTRIERIEAVGTALTFLVAELIGVVAIRDFCFS